MSPPDWIAVDWGTSRLRVHAMAGQRAVESRASDAGMGALEPCGFEPALLALIDDWLGERGVPVIACGMVGSRQGWAEAAYVPVPCQPPTLALATQAPASDPRLTVSILPGLRQDTPADVMRGEETQIAGFLAGMPDFDGVLCLPGTHSKWVRISAGEVVSFQTFMTGELFGLLSHASVLRHSVAGDGWDEAGFDAAIDDALSRPAAVAAKLFGLRAESLLQGLTPGVARARLSGLLLGLELGAARPYWLGQQVGLIGAAALAEVYRAALSRQGVTAMVADGAEMTLAGLWAAREGA